MNRNCDIEPKRDAFIHHSGIEYGTIEYYAILIPPDHNKALEEEKHQIYLTTIGSFLVKDKSNWYNKLYYHSKGC